VELQVFPFVKGFWTKIAIEHDSFLDVDGRSGVEEWSGVGEGEGGVEVRPIGPNCAQNSASWLS